MPEHNETSGETEKRQQEDCVRRFLRRTGLTGIAIAIWLFISGSFLLRLYLYDHVITEPYRTIALIDSMFSLAIVIVIVVHAVMYNKQAEAMNAQVQQTERAIKAAEDNVATVEKTAIYANRAYITVRIQKSYASHVLDLRIENSGNTPANNVIVSHTCGFREQPPDGLDADFSHHRQ